MNTLKQYALYILWVLALVGTLGSLYFSNVLHFPPCVFCWWQRIFMYPLVVLIPIGILKKDATLPLYSLVMGIIGFGIGVYHNLLYYQILPEAAAPCLQGVSCTTKFIDWLGFVTIPLLSLAGFSAIIIVSIIAMKGTKYASRS